MRCNAAWVWARQVMIVAMAEGLRQHMAGRDDARARDYALAHGAPQVERVQAAAVADGGEARTQQGLDVPARTQQAEPARHREALAQ